MSDALAISAVTGMLHHLLTQGLRLDDAISGAIVTTQPLDKARDAMNPNQLNLYLYHTMLNAAWRNMDVPWRTRPGESAHTPLALNLYYLVTAYYGESEDTIDNSTDASRLLGSHRLLGRAMSVLHDYAVLDAEAIHSILPPQDRLEHPYDQIEHVRITPQPLTVDEISKLWSSFQTEYRLSAAYEVSVVLIESTRAAKTPLPVLRRGADDQGVLSQPELTPPYPTLTDLQLPDNQPAILLGQTMTLNGHHLGGDEVIAQFSHRLLDTPFEVAVVAGGTATTVQVSLPDAPALWPAGVYTVSLVVRRTNEPERVTNELPFALAPAVATTAVDPPPDPGVCDALLSVGCQPEAWPGQHVALLLGQQSIPADPFTAQTDLLSFCLRDMPAGDYFIRLRVDGVDSLLIDYTATPPVFDAAQKVTIP